MKLFNVAASGTALLRDGRGTISIVSGLVLPVMLAATALAVDLGQAYLDRRTAQSIVDLAAINAANNIDIAEEAARATLAANKFDKVDDLQVVKGRNTADARIPAGSRFSAGVQPYNAVQVSLKKKLRLNFAATFVRKDMELSVSAIGQASSLASFSVGSRLAAVRGGIANQVLGNLLGTNVSLSIMDYQALASANVQIDKFLGSVGGTADLQVATFNDVVKSDVGLSDVIAGASAALAGHNADASAALERLAASVPKSLHLPMAQLIDVGSLGSTQIDSKNAGLSATLSVLDILQSAALIANGRHQFELDLNLGVPGISKLTATVYIGERPAQTSWVAAGDNGATISTVQTRVRVVAEIGGSGQLAGITIRLPIYAELASARATLESVTCSTTDKSATVGVLTGVGRIAIADLTDAELEDPPVAFVSGKLVATPLLSITAGAEVAIQNSDPVSLTFCFDRVPCQITAPLQRRRLSAESGNASIGCLAVTEPCMIGNFRSHCYFRSQAGCKRCAVAAIISITCCFSACGLPEAIIALASSATAVLGVI